MTEKAIEDLLVHPGGESLSLLRAHLREGRTTPYRVVRAAAKLLFSQSPFLPLGGEHEDHLVEAVHLALLHDRGGLFVLGESLEKTFEVDPSWPRTGLLHAAARRGLSRLMAQLLSWGANPDLRDGWGRTPLFYAATAEAVEVLVEAGADLEAKDRWGRTPLFDHEHLSWRRVEALARLLEKGANPRVRSEDGRDPLVAFLEARVHRYDEGAPSFVELLLERGGSFFNLERALHVTLTQGFGDQGARVLELLAERSPELFSRKRTSLLLSAAGQLGMVRAALSVLERASGGLGREDAAGVVRGVILSPEPDGKELLGLVEPYVEALGPDEAEELLGLALEEGKWRMAERLAPKAGGLAPSRLALIPPRLRKGLVLQLYELAKRKAGEEEAFLSLVYGNPKRWERSWGREGARVIGWVKPSVEVLLRIPPRGKEASLPTYHALLYGFRRYPGHRGAFLLKATEEKVLDVFPGLAAEMLEGLGPGEVDREVLDLAAARVLEAAHRTGWKGSFKDLLERFLRAGANPTRFAEEGPMAGALAGL